MGAGCGCFGTSSREKHLAAPSARSDASRGTTGDASAAHGAQSAPLAASLDRMEVQSVGSFPQSPSAGLGGTGDYGEALDQFDRYDPNRTVPRGHGAAPEDSIGFQKKPLGRLYSIRSEQALRQLGELEDRLTTIEKRVAELGRSARSLLEATGAGGRPPEAVGKIKTELALLEAEAHKLESSGVDNVYTGELESGKDTAKETKKGQLGRLEALFGQIDEVFKLIQNSWA
mmetsp:Transcript_2215/g.4351  ORF Transcript_2215/g.4351 Transcript_2215/m.4351 type:complete len:230 (+) Transcript_2215:107-796(+)